MKAQPLIVAAVLTAAIMGCVWLSSAIDGEQDHEAAIVAAIEGRYLDYFDAEEISNPPEEYVGLANLCMKNNTEADHLKIRDLLKGSIVQVVPIEECTIEGYSPLGVALWFGKDGAEAFRLSIMEINCTTHRSCVVDLDWESRGDAYSVERIKGEWTVTAREMRWVI